MRHGTAKVLTLFTPPSGHTQAKGLLRCTHVVLHPWLKEALSEQLDALSEPTTGPDPEAGRQLGESWFEGLSRPPPLPDELPPLRALLVMDNLAGHNTPSLVQWPLEHAIRPLDTPPGGSRLNMSESIQRILQRRALAGQSPETPTEIIGKWRSTNQITRWRHKSLHKMVTRAPPAL